MDNKIILIIWYVGIILIVMSYLIVKRLSFRKLEKKMEQSKIYMGIKFYFELKEKYTEFLWTLKLGVVILAISTIILIIELIRYYK